MQKCYHRKLKKNIEENRKEPKEKLWPKKGEKEGGENEHKGGGGKGRNEVPYIATSVCRYLYPSQFLTTLLR